MATKTVTVHMNDGTVITLAEDAGNRAVYALASLAVSPVGAHLNVSRVTDQAGVVLWQNSPLIDCR